MEQKEQTRTMGPGLPLLGLILLVGINLRTAMLGIPPILPLLSRDLHLSYTETGLVTSLPTLVMAAASFPAGKLIERFGGRLMVACGLVLLALGTVLRALWLAILPLYIFTALLSLGSTFSQTAIPTLTRQWFPRRIGFATALYTDGLVIGETLGAVLTLPLIVWLGQGAWSSSFLFWSVPTVLTLILWLWFAPSSQTITASPPAASHPAQEPALTMPKPRMNRFTLWAMGLLTGSAQLIYFGTNTWIAPYNQAIHAPAMTPIALGFLNAAQLPTTLALTFFADRLVGRRTPFVLAGLCCLIALGGLLWTPPTWQPLWAAILGGTSILTFTLGIALPALLAKQEQVAAWTGTMLALGYAIAFAGPFLGGWLWDRLHIPAIAFLPLALASVLIPLLTLFLPAQQRSPSMN
jgi:CP family cyanate transporter-like MFS transporter